MPAQGPNWSELAICQGLSAAEIDAVFAGAPKLHLTDGETLFGEGDAGDALYLILEGKIEVSKVDGGGRAQRLATVESGHVLGEMSLISENVNRSASAKAMGNATVLKVAVEPFRKLLAQNNVPALKLVHNLA